jgi:hypothetical protein
MNHKIDNGSNTSAKGADMTSITIHGLDEPLDSLIREKARREGLSLNKTIKLLLAEALGISPESNGRQSHFDDLCGIWTPEELVEFQGSTRELAEIDPRDWE